MAKFKNCWLWQLSHIVAVRSTTGYFLLITPVRIDRKPDFRLRVASANSAQFDSTLSFVFLCVGSSAIGTIFIPILIVVTFDVVGLSTEAPLRSPSSVRDRNSRDLDRPTAATVRSF
jgi:hypothetical protein